MRDLGVKYDRNVMAFTALAFVETSIVAMHTLYKAANLRGLSFFVYVTYSYAFGSAFLLVATLAFVLASRRRLPRLEWPVLGKIALLSLMGFLGRMCSFKGVEYSSPALASSINTLSPGFTFVLAVLFRMESLEMKSWTTRAKMIGTVILMLGALVMVIYKGPEVTWPSLSLQTPRPNWAIGGLLMIGDKVLNSSSFILQNHIMKIYPSELTMTLIYSLIITIITLPVSFAVENDLSAWKLTPDIRFITIAYSSLFGPVFIATVYSYCLPLKGPLYVSIFTPISIVIATTASVVFLGELLHIGSVIGAGILLAGFYCVLWGKATEEKSKLCGNSESHTPLLHQNVLNVNKTASVSNL